MSIPKHVKEHAALGIPDAIQKEWGGIQLATNAGTPSIIHGITAANMSTVPTAVTLHPFIKPAGAGDLKTIKMYGENNGGNTANRVKFCLWDANGVLFDDGAKSAVQATTGVKSISWLGGIAIPTDSFWFGFAPYEDGGTWQATEYRAAEAAAYQGYKGLVTDTEIGTVGAAIYYLPLTNPTDTVPDLSDTNMLRFSGIDKVFQLFADYE